MKNESACNGARCSLILRAFCDIKRLVFKDNRKTGGWVTTELLGTVKYHILRFPRVILYVARGLRSAWYLKLVDKSIPRIVKNDSAIVASVVY